MERFFKSVNKAKDHFQLISRSVTTSVLSIEQTPDYFFIKCGSKGMQNYVSIYTNKDKYMTLLNLKNLEQNLNNKLFIRVHKSYIVSINKIEGIEGNEIFIQSFRIPISRNYRE